MSDDLPVCDCGNYRDICGCPEPPPERAILTDLIAELRDGTWEADCYCCYIDRDGCATRDMADRAEDRLKGLNDE